jgi:hypothetical protein
MTERNPESQRPNPAGEAAREVRSLLGDGERWMVYEIQAPAFDRRGGKHLIFESTGVMRRVRDYPASWRELSDAALYALSLSPPQGRRGD